MTFKTLIAVAVTAAFALPFSALAAGDKADKASSGSSAGTSASGSASTGATKSDGGAEAMFKSLDKNKDGFMSKEEVKGTPHDKDFSSLDKDNDGKLSPQEHAAAPEHSGKAGAGASASESKKPESSSKPKY